MIIIPIDTQQLNQFNETKLIDYYRNHRSLNDRLQWTKLQLTALSNLISNQITTNHYQRDSKQDLLIILKLNLLINVLISHKLFNRLNTIIITSIKTTSNYSFFIKTKRQLLQILNSTQVKMNFKHRHTKLYLSLLDILTHSLNRFSDIINDPSINQTSNLNHIVMILSSNSSWRHSYRNDRIFKNGQYTNDNQIINQTCNTYKTLMISQQQDVINEFLWSALSKQSFTTTKSVLTLLFNLKLVTPEDLLSYYDYCIDQYFKITTIVNNSLYLKLPQKSQTDFTCRTHFGKNRHYYHELILSKFLSKTLHCGRRRPFSLNVYFKMLSLLLTHNRGGLNANQHWPIPQIN